MSFNFARIQQLLRCKYCNDPIRNPKTLPCLHSFCESCLYENVDSESNKVSCVQCGKLFTGAISELPAEPIIERISQIIVEEVICLVYQNSTNFGM